MGQFFSWLISKAEPVASHKKGSPSAARKVEKAYKIFQTFLFGDIEKIPSRLTRSIASLRMAAESREMK
jgi:hypothetical protein